jgi:hypothetical protein
LWDALEDFKWLYRGVPSESPEVTDVEHAGEVRPQRPERVGQEWRRRHSAGMTETGYTSWSSDRAIAEAAASESSNSEGLSGRYEIFRVLVEALNLDRVFEGRADEDEYLIEGTVEGVEYSGSATDDEDD